MKRRTIKLISASVIMLTTVHVSEAQKGINSIYSAYGLGDYYIRDNNAYYGMGQLGVAMKSDKTINDVNPASYSSIQAGRLMFDVSFGGSSVQYINERERHTAGDFTFRRAALGLNLVNNVGTVIGLRRYTDVNYLTVGSKTIEGSTATIPINIEGTGGLNQFYFGNSVLIKKHLSLGITAGYLFGSVNQKQTAATTSAIFNFVNNTYYNNFTVNGGLQYQFNTKKLLWTLGAFYQPEINLKTLADQYVTGPNDVTIVADKTIDGRFKFPSIYGGGISVQNTKLKLGADYIQHNWKATGYSGNGFESTNAQSLALGGSWSLTRHTKWGDRPGLSLYAGYINELSYLIIQGQKIQSNSITLGFSVPAGAGYNYYGYSAGIKIGTRGQGVYPLVKENYIQFCLNVSLSTIMMRGGRKYD
ncbi:hypothetical protein [Pinibacter soli]|uniref:Outer membrane protein n=1 Tax=Pinibacter soli TaxID=3044211 RepID=A0ABT6R8K3_9BACT|nr:hypothetical protein [Pinibacter soli]MDI3318894.1 hypothetical protein [Pinibacter soli]